MIFDTLTIGALIIAAIAIILVIGCALNRKQFNNPNKLKLTRPLGKACPLPARKA